MLNELLMVCFFPTAWKEAIEKEPEFESFLKSLPADCIVDIRIADDVLEEEDWGIDQLIITHGIVRYQIHCAKGVYTMPDMVGWNVGDVVTWSQYDDCNSHPSNSYQVKLYTYAIGKEVM